MNVGLVTTSAEPRAPATPLTNVVLPDASPPVRSTTSPTDRRRASAAAMRIVWSGSPDRTLNHSMTHPVSRAPRFPVEPAADGQIARTGYRAGWDARG